MKKSWDVAVAADPAAADAARAVAAEPVADAAGAQNHKLNLGRGALRLSGKL